MTACATLYSRHCSNETVALQRTFQPADSRRLPFHPARPSSFRFVIHEGRALNWKHPKVSLRSVLAAEAVWALGRCIARSRHPSHDSLSALLSNGRLRERCQESMQQPVETMTAVGESICCIFEIGDLQNSAAVQASVSTWASTRFAMENVIASVHETGEPLSQCSYTVPCC